VSNAQYAASMGFSAIAVSADTNTTSDSALCAEAAKLILKLINVLDGQAHKGQGPLLPKGVALNVNYPKFAAGQSAGLQWALTRHGTSSGIKLAFAPDLSKLVFSPNTAPPTKQQRDDEAVVNAAGKITVTVMQAGFDASEQTRRSVGKTLGELADGPEP